MKLRARSRATTANKEMYKQALCTCSFCFADLSSCLFAVLLAAVHNKVKMNMRKKNAHTQDSRVFYCLLYALITWLEEERSGADRVFKLHITQINCALPRNFMIASL